MNTQLQLSINNNSQQDNKYTINSSQDRKYKKIKLSYKKKLNCPILWIVHYFDNEPYNLDEFYLACIISEMIEEQLKKNNVYILDNLFGIKSYKDLFKNPNFDKLSYELIVENKDFIKEKLNDIQILKLTEITDSLSIHNILYFLNKSHNIKTTIKNIKSPSLFIKYFYNVLKKIYLLDEHWNKFINKFNNYLYNSNDTSVFTNNDIKYIYNIIHNYIGKDFCIIKNSSETKILIKNIIHYLFLSILYNKKYDDIKNIIKNIIKKSFNDANFEILKLIDEIKINDINYNIVIDYIDDNLKILFLYFILYYYLFIEEDVPIDLEYLLSYRLDWGHFGFQSHKLLLNKLLEYIPNKYEKILIIADSTIDYQMYDEKELTLKNIYKNSYVQSKSGLYYTNNDALTLLPSNYKDYDTILSINGCNDLQILIEAFKNNFDDVTNLSYDDIRNILLTMKEYINVIDGINNFWNKF